MSLPFTIGLNIEEPEVRVIDNYVSVSVPLRNGILPKRLTFKVRAFDEYGRLVYEDEETIVARPFEERDVEFMLPRDISRVEVEVRTFLMKIFEREVTVPAPPKKPPITPPPAVTPPAPPPEIKPPTPTPPTITPPAPKPPPEIPKPTPPPTIVPPTVPKYKWVIIRVLDSDTLRPITNAMIILEGFKYVVDREGTIRTYIIGDSKVYDTIIEAPGYEPARIKWRIIQGKLQVLETNVKYDVKELGNTIELSVLLSKIKEKLPPTKPAPKPPAKQLPSACFTLKYVIESIDNYMKTLPDQVTSIDDVRQYKNKIIAIIPREIRDYISIDINEKYDKYTGEVKSYVLVVRSKIKECAYEAVKEFKVVKPKTPTQPVLGRPIFRAVTSILGGKIEYGVDELCDIYVKIIDPGGIRGRKLEIIPDNFTIPEGKIIIDRVEKGVAVKVANATEALKQIYSEKRSFGPIQLYIVPQGVQISSRYLYRIPVEKITKCLPRRMPSPGLPSPPPPSERPGPGAPDKCKQLEELLDKVYREYNAKIPDPIDWRTIENIALEIRTKYYGKLWAYTTFYRDPKTHKIKYHELIIEIDPRHKCYRNGQIIHRIIRRTAKEWYESPGTQPGTPVEEQPGQPGIPSDIDVCKAINHVVYLHEGKIYVNVSVTYPGKIIDTLTVKIFDEKRLLNSATITTKYVAERDSSFGMHRFKFNPEEISGNTLRIVVTSSIFNKTCEFKPPVPRIEVPTGKKTSTPVATGSIKIISQDTTGNPVVVERLLIRGTTEANEEWAKEYTNVHSGQIISGIPAGVYNIKGENKNYNPAYAMSVHVRPNKVVEAHLVFTKTTGTAIGKPKKGKLTIIVYGLYGEVVPNAEIRVDGKLVGYGRVTVELNEGWHTIYVTAEGYEPVEDKVYVHAGKHITKEIGLVPKHQAPPSGTQPTTPKRVTLVIRPAISAMTRIVQVPANVYVNDKYVGYGREVTVRVAPGTYTIRAVSSEYGVGEKTVIVRGTEARKDVWVVLHKIRVKPRPMR